MNTSLLFAKIIERNLSINETLEIINKICTQEKLAVKDILWIKNVLTLSNSEAIDIFLS